MRRILMGVGLVLCLWAATLSVPIWAQWTGEIGGGYVWQNYSGNENAFRTQYGQQQGWLLESFNLAYAEKGRDVFSLQASGFGQAEPSSSAALLFRAKGGWTFTLNYDKQNSYYNIANGDLANRTSDWTIERWRGAIVWDGWSAAKLTLNLRYYKKDGYVYRGIYGQNNAFSTKDNYDQDMKEASIKIETKTLPVYISFEQAYTVYEQQDRWEPNGSQAIFPPSGSYLAAASTPRDNKTTIPASRLIMTYRNTWIDVAGSLFYSKSSMDTNGNRLTIYDTYSNGGQFQWMDNTGGNASMDNKAGNIDANIHLGSGWSFRFAGDYRDSTQDSNLLGAHILRLGNPGGFQQDIVTPINENGFFDVKDTIGKFEVAKQFSGWSLYGGYQAGSRDVSWQRENDDPGEDVSRTGHGWYFGGTWSRTPALRINAEYADGTFSNYVFRTDPEQVKRFTFKLSSQLGGGWNIGARANWEWADNPPQIANVSRQAQSFGANFGWANKKGDGGVNILADILTLDAFTAIYYPSGRPGVSRYNTDVLALTANGFFTVGRVHFTADLTKVNDTGTSWPLTSWGGDLRAAIDGPKNTQFVLFGQYRSYVESYTNLDNYYMRRYGVIIRWRF